MTPGSISNPSIVVAASGGSVSTNTSVTHNPQTPHTSSQPSSGKTNVTKGITIGCHMNMCPGFISNSSSSSNTIITTTAGSSNSSNSHNNNNNNSNSHNVSSSLSKCSNKFPSKIDPRFTGPSTLRQLLPIALCVLSFATVLSVLIIYMDTTEIRHQQFRLNMSRDYELIGVAQDDPTLVAFIREIHMKKYPLNFLKNAPIEHLNFTERHELTPDMARYIASLIRDKINGNFIQSMTGATSYTMTAPLLADTLNWGGIIVEPEPRRYFTLRKQNVHRPKVQVVHACLSPNGYPKEVTLHNDEDADVRINSLVDDEISSFNSRVKCFPLYTIMLAVNKTEYDLLSLGCPGHELQILQTLPFRKVNIEMISIHLTQNQSNATEYIQSITKFLFGKSYKLQKRFENNYIYQRINNKRLIRKVTP